MHLSWTTVDFGIFLLDCQTFPSFLCGLRKKIIECKWKSWALLRLTYINVWTLMAPKLKVIKHIMYKFLLGPAGIMTRYKENTLFCTASVSYFDCLRRFCSISLFPLKSRASDSITGTFQGKSLFFKIIKQSSIRGKRRILNNSLTRVNWIRMGIKRAFRSRGLITFKQRKYISRRRTVHYYLLSGIKLILKVNAKIRLMITRDKSLQ